MPLDHLAVLRTEAGALVEACEAAALDDPIASCPGWDVAALAGHVGFIHRWATSVVTTGHQPAKGALGPRAGRDEAVTYLAEGIAPLLAALEAADPEAPCWNFSPAPQVAGFWLRRQAQETAVHRWDAQTAGGAAPRPLDAAVAADGIDELFHVQFPRILTMPERPTLDLGGSVHLHCTDTEGEWTFRIDNGRLQMTLGHAKGDVALRGPASQLLLALWRRVPCDAEGLEAFGDTAILDRLFASEWI